MIFGAKVVIILETKEYFTYNLVIWLYFAWSFGLIVFGYLAFFRLVAWQGIVRRFGTNSFGHLKPPDCSLLLIPFIKLQILHKQHRV